MYEEEYPEYLEQPEKAEGLDSPKETTAVGAVEISKDPKDTIAEDLGKSCGQAARLYHLI